MSNRRGIAGRDQGVSAFSATLGRLCDCISAIAVALVDDEGETVDYAGYLPPYSAKVMAAELGIVRRVQSQSRAPDLAASHRIIIRARHYSYHLESVDQAYTLVVQMPRYAFRISQRAIAEAVREICGEAQMPLPARFRNEHWTRVEVLRSDGNKKQRPKALWLNGKWTPIEVLGQVLLPGATDREVGFRARLGMGEEITLVSEGFDRWFVDAGSFLGSFG